jgi:hypothetical protein
VLEEVRDLRDRELRQVAHVSMCRYSGVSLSIGTASNLVSPPASVRHLEDADGRQRTTTPGIRAKG